MPFRMASPPASSGTLPQPETIRHGRSDERAVARPQLELLSPAVRARLAATDQMHLSKGEKTDWAGRDRLHLVRSGWLAQFRTLTDGRRHILRFLMPGDMVGLTAQFSGTVPTPAVALTEARVATAPVTDLIDPTSATALQQACVMLALENVREHEALLSLGGLGADERLAALFLTLFERAETRDLVSDRGLRLPLTQQDIADALGLSPVHTNRMVMKLQRAGLIRLKSEWLQILDGPGLQALAQWSRPMAWTRRSDQGSARLADIRQAPPQPERRVKRILVVEDDQFLALHMQAILRSLGFAVVGPAPSLKTGLRLAEESDDIDAAILDVRLDQDQRVFPVAQTLQRRSIPFSFMTGYTDPDLAGFEAPVIKKPLDDGSVAAILKRLIH